MKKILAIILAVCVIAGFALWKISAKKKKDGKSKDESAAVVVRKNFVIKVLATGVLEPRLKIQVTAPNRGQIDDIMVDEGDRVRKGQRLAWLSSADRIALLDAARINLENAKDSGDKDKIAQAQQEWDVAQGAYQKIPLLSPIEGEVTLRAVEPGQSVNANEVILGISDRLVIKCQVDETDIGKIKTGMHGMINLDAYPEERLFGKVTKIAHESVVTSNVTTYQVTVELVRSSELLKSGMTANVEFIIAQVKDALLLPVNAVANIAGKKYAFVMSEGKEPERREVETGAQNEQSVEITSGLNEGDKVIIRKKNKDNQRGGQQNSVLFGGAMPRGGGFRR